MSAPQWTGTPAEWDTERDRREKALHDANGRLGAVSYKDLATATMPPRPVEPPSVMTASGWRVRFETEKRTFHLKSALMTGTSAYANSVSEVARRIMTTDEELDAIRALRAPHVVTEAMVDAALSQRHQSSGIWPESWPKSWPKWMHPGMRNRMREALTAALAASTEPTR